MTKYNLKISDQRPSDEEIDKQKDFKKLKHRYQNVVKPHYKTRLDKFRNRRLFMLLFLVVVIAIVVYISDHDADSGQNGKDVSGLNDTVMVDSLRKPVFEKQKVRVEADSIKEEE